MAASQRSGEIVARPLPSLLLDLHFDHAAGRLTVRRAGVVKTIDLVAGDPIRVSSSLRDETLGHFLVQRGIISEAVHKEAVQRAAQTKAKLGETLVAMGSLPLEQLLEQLALQHRHKLVAVLRWPQGSWNFDHQPGIADTDGVRAPLVEVVLAGLRDTASGDPERLRRFDGASFELTERGRRLVPDVQATFGEAAASAVVRGGAITAIERGCGDRFTARSVLDALDLCDAITWQRLRATPLPKTARGSATEIRSANVGQGEASLPKGVAPRRSEPALPGVAPAAERKAAAPAAARSPAKPQVDSSPSSPWSMPSPVHAPEPSPLPAPPQAPLPAAAPSAAPPPPVSSRTATRREVWAPPPSAPSRSVSAPGPAEPQPFVPRTITSVANRRAAIAWAPRRPDVTPLYDLLFDDQAASDDDGAVPLATFDDDSGVVSTDEFGLVNDRSDEAARARRALVAEADRIRTADLYTILRIERTASEAEIAAAISERQRTFAREYYARFALGLDQPHLEEVLATYAGARDILLDDEARRSYDRALDGTEAASAHTMDTEVSFREAEDLLATQRFAAAIALLETIVAHAPAQADFHATLGWAHWLHKGPSLSAGDTARPHLNRALEIDPEHVAAHVHRGIIGASLGEDDAEVVFHLERALELRPARTDALHHLEPILLRRGELRRLERLYKRLLFRLSTNFPDRAADLWARLATLYAQHLDDRPSAEAALANARVMAPNHPLIAEFEAELEALLRPPPGDVHPLEQARGRLRRTRDLDAAAALMRSAGTSGDHDAAFVTAATMVALGTADPRMAEMYERHRVRRAALPAHLSVEHWAQLRHRDDSAELGALIASLAPAIQRVAPVALKDAGVDATMRVGDDELPAPFAKLRASIAKLLGVSPCPVYARPDLERHVQLVASDPPALIAGDEALTAPERPELVCRLARALCQAAAGRATGGSRSGTVLRAVVLAIVREATLSAIGAHDALAGEADAALDALSLPDRGDARAAALRLVARGAGINLSVWSRSLQHTADRAGLLLCGDIPTALAVARECGWLEPDLVEFAFSAEHVGLRASLGLSITS
jgi:tetratricopeptide (TPR) repeat protein